MLDNHVYNLMNQLTQEHKSLWRIKKMYKEDAGDCEDCKAFWNMMEQDKEEHIRDLKKLISDHME